MNKKGFVNIIVIIGVVILVGVASYFIVNQQTPTPTRHRTPSQLAVTLTSTPNDQPNANYSYVKKINSQIQTLLADYLAGKDIGQTASGLGLKVSDSAEVLVDIYITGSVDDAFPQLKNLGMQVVAFDDTNDIVEGWLPLDAVIAVAQLANTKALMPVTAFGIDEYP